jgi:hypothetical protein
MPVGPAPKSQLSPETLRARGWTMPGSIRKRGRSYALRLYVGKRNGKSLYKWLTYKTRAEADAVQRELASHTLAHAAGISLYGSPRERLGPYLVDWVERQAGGSRRKPCGGIGSWPGKSAPMSWGRSRSAV